MGGSGPEGMTDQSQQEAAVRQTRSALAMDMELREQGCQ